MKRIQFWFLIGLCFSSGRVVANPDDSMNFRFSPLGALIGIYSTQLDINSGDQWTVGPSASYWKMTVDKKDNLVEDIKVEAWAIGVRANWYKNGVYSDGLYVAPSLHYFDADARSRDVLGEVKGSGTGFTAQAVAGYGWYWESFNILLGGGVSVPMGNAKLTVTDSVGNRTESDAFKTRIAFDFTLGWTF